MTVGVLNVGAGDTKLSFDPSDPKEAIRAARIVRDMLRRGYALLVEVAPGQYQRATDFDEARHEYIIADLDPMAAAVADFGSARPQGEADEPEDQKAAAGSGSPAPEGRARGGRKQKRVKASDTRAVAVSRSAGG